MGAKMSRVLRVTHRTAYNKHEYFDPANDTAKVFCRLLGQKTLMRPNLEVIRELGYRIEVFTTTSFDNVAPPAGAPDGEADPNGDPDQDAGSSS